MERWTDRPLRFSEILDLSFRIIKENFTKLFTMTLILTGPVYLVQLAAMITGGSSLFREPVSSGVKSFLNILEQPEMSSSYLNYGSPQFIFYTLLIFLLSIVLTPVAYASLIIATDYVRRNEPLQVSKIIKNAFSRFWALLGSTIVYTLVLFGLIVGISIIVGIFIGVSGISNYYANGFSSAFIIQIALLVLAGIALFSVFLYLLTRWSFYFGAVVFEKVSPGLGKSWRLTRGHFWRLAGLYIVLSILTFVISLAFQAIIQFFLGNSVVAALLNSLVSMIYMIVLFVAYAVTYFDLRLRNEGTDLESLVQNYSLNNVDGNSQPDFDEHTEQ